MHIFIEKFRVVIIHYPEYIIRVLIERNRFTHSYVCVKLEVDAIYVEQSQEIFCE